MTPIFHSKQFQANQVFNFLKRKEKKEKNDMVVEIIFSSVRKANEKIYFIQKKIKRECTQGYLHMS